MSGLDSIAGPLALKLIAKFGTPISYTSVVTGAYNPVTSSASVTPTVYQISGVIDEYAESLRFLGEKLQNKTSIQEGDKKVTIAASGLAFTPNIGDLITAFGVRYVVTSIASQTSGSAIALYVLHLRKN